MADIVISEFMDEASVTRLSGSHDVLYDPKLADDASRLGAELANARVLVVRNRTQVNGELLAAAPNLRVVGRLGVGLDNIDLDACAARGVAVKPATGANNVSVAEYVLGAALMLIRGAYRAEEAVIAGQWPRQSLIGGELAGRILGLVGYGAIARETAKRARAFDMTIVATDPFLGEDHPGWGETRSLSFRELLTNADVVSLHVPLTDETRRMIDADALSSMKQGAILINAARGGIVDEAALVAALYSGRLAGAALDVFENEPLSAEEGARFAGLQNLVLTPHIAGITNESNSRVGAVTVDNVLEVLGQD